MTQRGYPVPPTVGAARQQLQDAKARSSQVMQDECAHVPRRVTLHGRDIVAALASSPLAEVAIERLPVKSAVRDIDL